MTDDTEPALLKLQVDPMILSCQAKCLSVGRTNDRSSGLHRTRRGEYASTLSDQAQMQTGQSVGGVLTAEIELDILKLRPLLPRLEPAIGCEPP